MMKNKMMFLRRVLMAGFVLFLVFAIGTAGASDCEIITTIEMIRREGIAVAGMIGCVGGVAAIEAKYL